LGEETRPEFERVEFATDRHRDVYLAQGGDVKFVVEDGEDAGEDADEDVAADKASEYALWGAFQKVGEVEMDLDRKPSPPTFVLAPPPRLPRAKTIHPFFSVFSGKKEPETSRATNAIAGRSRVEATVDSKPLVVLPTPSNLFVSAKGEPDASTTNAVAGPSRIRATVDSKPRVLPKTARPSNPFLSAKKELATSTTNAIARSSRVAATVDFKPLVLPHPAPPSKGKGKAREVVEVCRNASLSHTSTPR
jgi:hypothetical protein